MALFRTGEKSTKMPKGYLYATQASGAITSGFNTLTYAATSTLDVIAFCAGYSQINGTVGLVLGLNADGTTTELGNLTQSNNINISGYDVVFVSGQVAPATLTYTLS